MAGLIQTALGQLLGAVGGAVVAGKKLYEKHEGQALQEEEEKSDKGSSEVAKTYKIAQEKGITAPEKIIFDEKGTPLATKAELAELMAKQSLSDSFSARKKGSDKIAARKKELEEKVKEGGK